MKLVLSFILSLVVLLSVSPFAGATDADTTFREAIRIAHATTGSVLVTGKVLIGDAANQAAAHAVSGDVTIATNGVTAIAAGVVVNADIAAAAAIELTKLEAVAPTYIVVGNAASQAVAVVVSGDATIDNAGALTVTGAAGDFAVVGTAEFTSTALDVTNGQAVAISSGSYVLTGIDGANNTTNTITIDAPSAAGQLLFLTVASSSTNLVTIADSSPVAASGAILLDGNDSALLIGVDASTWSLVSESDNN